MSKDSSIWRSCSTIWIDRLNFQIRDTDANYGRFCASRSTIVSLSLSLSLSLYIYIYIYIYIVHIIYDLITEIGLNVLRGRKMIWLNSIYTVQNKQKNTTPDIGGADSIGMGSKISQIKTQKKELKPDNPMSHKQTTMLTSWCGKPRSHNHHGNTSNLKITQYRFRSSLKIWSSLLDWTQIPILMF
jgi:hypothetical protein